MIDPYTKRYPTPRPPIPEPPPPLEPPTASYFGIDGGPASCFGGEHLAHEPRWVWPGRIPMQKLTLIAGEPGVGKSMAAADLAARWTAGLPWPDGQAGGEPGDVVFLVGEDSISDTVMPRFNAGGGDGMRVFSLHHSVDAAGVIHSLNFPRDCDELGALIEKTKLPRLIVLDPLAAFLGPTGDWGGEMQCRLAGLIGMARVWDATILAITHRDLRPTGPGRPPSGGALGLLAAARAAFQVVADPKNPALRHFVALKNNLGPLAPRLAFRIDSGHCDWEALDVSPPAEPAEPTERMLAGKWLIEVLSAGPVAATELHERGQAALFSRATLRRAARDSAVRARCDSFQGKWVWELSAPPPKA